MSVRGSGRQHNLGEISTMKMRWLAIGYMAVCSVFTGIQSAAAQEKGHLYAHRGGAFEFEENTLEAFRGSYAKGLRGFETDVRMTKDGVLVVLHDDSLDRTHNATGPVEHKTAAELRSVATKGKGQPMLFLDELLDYLADKPVYLELEMKTSNKNLYPDERLEEYCRKLHAAATSRQPEGAVYLMTSFDQRPLKLIKSFDPEADLLLITGGPCSKEIVEQALQLGINRIGCRMEGSSRASVREAQKAGLRVNGWPGHTLQDYHLAVGLGVDGICTDIPVAIQTWITNNQQAAP